MANQDISYKVIRLAQSDHVSWKKRLHMLLMGRSQVNAKKKSDHNSCRLGRWISSVSEARLRAHPDFQALEGPHYRVHHQGIAAAQLVSAGNYPAALQAVAEMEAASEQVLNRLRSLENHFS